MTDHFWIYASGFGLLALWLFMGVYGEFRRYKSPFWFGVTDITGFRFVGLNGGRIGWDEWRRRAALQAGKQT